MKTETYHVFWAGEGSAEKYLGEASTLKDARRMAAEHFKGLRGALAQWMYDTARAAGHCDGICAPPAVSAPVAWFGRGRNYCACIERRGL